MITIVDFHSVVGVIQEILTQGVLVGSYLQTVFDKINFPSLMSRKRKSFNAY